MEYSLQSRKILQCYGDNDSKPEDSVMEFVNKKWLRTPTDKSKNYNKLHKSCQEIMPKFLTKGE